MFPSSSFSRLKPARRLLSSIALSVALAGGLVATPAVQAAPKDKAKDQAKQDYSKAFVEAYTPVADVVNAEGGDIASVSGQFPAVVAAASTPDDRFAAGNLMLVAGNKTTDTQLQRQGLEMMVASGKAPADQVSQFHFFIGSLAYNAKDYAAARQSLEAAMQAGYSAPDADIPGMIAESYFAEGNTQGGLDYLRKASAERVAAGGQVPERWLLKGLQTAYDQQMTPQVTELSQMLVTSYPTDRNWMSALQVVNALNDFEPQQRLDLLRLMRETKALSDRSEYIRYIEAADPRIMSNEVKGVLAEAVAAGKLDTSDTYYTEVKSIADQRAPMDQAEAPKLVTEAKSASDPLLSAEAGDVSYSLGNFAQAEEMYQLALDKGVTDRDTVLTRLGIAQTKQGKFADAQATLGQVSGARAPIAQMWSAYAKTQAG